MKKQRGTSSEDLWIACEVSQKSGVATDTLFDTKQLKKDWKEVIAAHGIDVKKLPKKLQASLLSGASPARLADAVVDDVFLRYRIFNEADLAGMRRSGVTNQEAVLAALLAARSGKPAPSYPAQVKTGVTTWGALMQKEKFEVKDLEREVAQLLRGRR